MELAGIIGAVVAALLVFILVWKTVRIVPQARARNIERLGRYRKTLEPGMNVILPFIDRVKPLIDLREQVVSFRGQPVITEDNLVVLIDTVLFFQVTDPRAADYEIVDYIQAIEQLTATMLRSVIGTMDLEKTLTSRDRINAALRGVLDDASGKWGIRVTRVEIKAIDPPQSVKDAMEKQMRAEREKRAAILNAEGVKQSQILKAEGMKQSAILTAEGDRQAAILKAQGQGQAIETVFQSIHRNDPDPKLLAYQYLQTLPQIAQGEGSTFWVIPSEVTTALKTLSTAFTRRDDTAAPTGDDGRAAAGATDAAAAEGAAPQVTEPQVAATQTAATQTAAMETAAMETAGPEAAALPGMEPAAAVAGAEAAARAAADMAAKAAEAAAGAGDMAAVVAAGKPDGGPGREGRAAGAAADTGGAGAAGGADAAGDADAAADAGSAGSAGGAGGAGRAPAADGSRRRTQGR